MKNRIKLIAAVLILVFGAGVVTESLEYFLKETSSSYSSGVSTLNSLPAFYPKNLEVEFFIPKPQHALERQTQGEFFNLQPDASSATASPEQPQIVTGGTIDPWSKS